MGIFWVILPLHPNGKGPLFLSTLLGSSCSFPPIVLTVHELNFGLYSGQPSCKQHSQDSNPGYCDISAHRSSSSDSKLYTTPRMKPEPLKTTSSSVQDSGSPSQQPPPSGIHKLCGWPELSACRKEESMSIIHMRVDMRIHTPPLSAADEREEGGFQDKEVTCGLSESP